MCGAKEQEKDNDLLSTAEKVSKSWLQHLLEDFEVYSVVKKALLYSLK